MVAETPVPKAAGEDNGAVVRVGIAEVGTVRPTSPGVGAGTAVVRGEVFVSEVLAADVVSDGATVVGSGVTGTLVAGRPVAGRLVAGRLVAGRLVAGRLVAGRLVAGRLVAGRLVAGRLVAGRLVAGPGVVETLVAGWGFATSVVDEPVGAESWVADARADGAVFDCDFAAGRALDPVIVGDVPVGDSTEAADDRPDMTAGELEVETAPVDAGEAVGAGLPVHPATTHVTHTMNAPMAAR